MSDAVSQPDSKPPPIEPMRTKPGLSTDAEARPGRWADVSPAIREKLGFQPDGTPEVITFNVWTSNPWTIVGTNGKTFATLSNMNLSVIKAVTTTGAPSLYWTLTLNVVSHGWTSSEPGQPQVQGRMQVNLLNAQSGLLLSMLQYFYVECGSNGPQLLTETFTTDVFSLIAKAHLAVEATFWPC